jgi:hypothetical protein
MSIVAVHGPNTFGTTQGGGQSIQSSPPGAQATKSGSNGLVFNFSFPNPGARPAADFNWTFTGPGNPVAQAARTSGSVTFTGPGAVTIVCTVSGATAPPPTNGAYTTSATATAGTPRMVEQSAPDEEGEEEASDVDVGYDPAAHTIDEVKEFVTEHPEEISDIYDTEEAGKARVTLLEWLQQQLG